MSYQDWGKQEERRGLILTHLKGLPSRIKSVPFSAEFNGGPAIWTFGTIYFARAQPAEPIRTFPALEQHNQERLLPQLSGRGSLDRPLRNS